MSHQPREFFRHRRHSVILVESDRKGFEATKLHHKLGIRASDTAELSFDDVRVPKENLIGEEGKASISSWSSLIELEFM